MYHEIQKSPKDLKSWVAHEVGGRGRDDRTEAGLVEVVEAAGGGVVGGQDPQDRLRRTDRPRRARRGPRRGAPRSRRREREARARQRSEARAGPGRGRLTPGPRTGVGAGAGGGQGRAVGRQSRRRGSLGGGFTRAGRGPEAGVGLGALLRGGVDRPSAPTAQAGHGDEDAGVRRGAWWVHRRITVGETRVEGAASGDRPAVQEARRVAQVRRAAPAEPLPADVRDIASAMARSAWVGQERAARCSAARSASTVFPSRGRGSAARRASGRMTPHVRRHRTLILSSNLESSRTSRGRTRRPAPLPPFAALPPSPEWPERCASASSSASSLS